MATSNTFSLIRLLFFIIALPLSINGQTKITNYSEGFIIVGDDAVIYTGPSGNKYTTSPEHPYFEKYDIEAPIEKHIQNMESEIVRLKKINQYVKSNYIDNEQYIKTNEESTEFTRKMLRKQYSEREFICIQYSNTIEYFKMRL